MVYYTLQLGILANTYGNLKKNMWKWQHEMIMVSWQCKTSPIGLFKRGARKIFCYTIYYMEEVTYQDFYVNKTKLFVNTVPI